MKQPKAWCRISAITLPLIILMISCQKEDVIVQSLYDLSGAPIKYDDSQATKFLNVATVSMKFSRSREENIVNMKSTIFKIMQERPETELILFPETATGWYIDDNDPVNYQKSISDTIPGTTTDILSQIADSLNVNIITGITERDNGKMYNSQVLISNEGRLLSKHRKYNLTPEDEKSGFSKGTASVDIVSINTIPTAMIICADVSSYRLTNYITDKKAKIIFHSMASNVDEFFVDPVSRQFNAWVVFSNRTGREGDNKYSGTVYVSDPCGTIRTSSSGKETVLYFKIGVR